MIRRGALLASLLLLVGATDVQGPELPAELQLGLLTKVLSFDRSDAFGPEIVVTVLFQPEFPASVRVREAWLEAARTAPPAAPGGAPLTVTSLAHSENFVENLRQQGTDVVVLAPLRSVDARRMAARIRAARMRTVTGSPAYGRGVAAVSLLIRDGRPRIVIDERLAQEEGSQFSSQLLRVSEVLR
jgi:hypothetical protein